LLWPSEGLRKSFTSALHSILSEIDNLNDSAQSLGALRDTLLPKLVTGQVDVSSLDLDALLQDSVA